MSATAAQSEFESEPIPYLSNQIRNHTTGWYVIEGHWYASEAQMREDYRGRTLVRVEGHAVYRPPLGEDNEDLIL
jgi:hypothetical protein